MATISIQFHPSFLSGNPLRPITKLNYKSHPLSLLPCTTASIHHPNHSQLYASLHYSFIQFHNLIYFLFLYNLIFLLYIYIYFFLVGEIRKKDELKLAKLAMVTLAAGVLAVTPVQDATAAKTGGRVGGQAFRSPAPPRSSGPRINNSRFFLTSYFWYHLIIRTTH